MGQDSSKPLVDTPEWQQWEKEHAAETAEADADAAEAELLTAYDDNGEPLAGGTRSQKLDAELQSEWQQLKRVAMQKFPEGIKILGLTPKNRLVAIAACLGWDISKISAASGIARSTVRKWINERSDIKLFMDEFNIRTGDKDVVKEKFSTLEYKAVQCIEAILSDKEKSDAVKRLQLDASKWVFERTRGKPNQPIEHKGEGLRAMLETMNKIGATDLTAAEEKELFAPSKLN